MCVEKEYTNRNVFVVSLVTHVGMKQLKEEIEVADLSKDVLLFSKEQRRMCETFESNNCIGCELYGEPCLIGGYRIGKDNDEHILDVVQKWHDEHSPKSYALDFFLKFPNAHKKNFGNSVYPDICRQIVYGGACETDIKSCCDCWNEPMEDKQ